MEIKHTQRVKKIRERDLKADTKHVVVMRHFLRNPEKMWKFMRMLYMSNIIAHMQDSLLQEFDEFAPYMCDRGIQDRMRNATKAFNRLVDGMYEATKGVYSKVDVDDKYAKIVDNAIKLQPIFDNIINDFVWHGFDHFRMVELERTLKKIAPPEAIERELSEYIDNLKVAYKDEYAAYEKLDADENKKKFSDALETMIFNNHKSA